MRWLLSFFLGNWLNHLSIVLRLKATMIKETNCEILEKFLRRKDIWSPSLYWLSHFCHSSCRTWCSGRSANVLSEQVIVQGLPISWLLNKWQHRTPLGFGTVLISACLCAIVLNLKKGTWWLRSYINFYFYIHCLSKHRKSKRADSCLLLFCHCWKVQSVSTKRC